MDYNGIQIEIIHQAGAYRPAVGRCACGTQIKLARWLNRCPKCEQEYDCYGNGLRPAKLRKAIEEAIGSQGLTSYEERNTSIRLTYDSNCITFDVLARIAEICGTKNINFSGERHEHRTSEVSADTSYIGELTIDGVKWPSQFVDGFKPLDGLEAILDKKA